MEAKKFENIGFIFRSGSKGRLLCVGDDEKALGSADGGVK
jgi:hypothetical protein